MSKKLQIAKDEQQLRMVTLIITLAAVLIATLQVFWPVSKDPNMLAEAGAFPFGFSLAAGILLALLQLARFEVPAVRRTVRVIAAVISAGVLLLLTVFLVTGLTGDTLRELWREYRKAEMPDLQGNAGMIYLYVCNYFLVFWQMVNAWMLPVWAVGVFRGGKSDRLLLIVFGALGAAAAGIHAWMTMISPGLMTEEWQMPALLRYPVVYILVPVVMLMVPVCAFCVGVVHKEKKTAA